MSKQIKGKGLGSSHAIATVRRFFPKVGKVIDADKQLMVNVTQKDVMKSIRGGHDGCAVALACKRDQKADGVIIARSIAYVIHGETATRYVVPPSVGREVVANDRGAAAEPGEYHLSPITGSRKLGVQRQRKDRATKGKSDGSRSRHVHVTEGIRTVLGAR